MRTPMCRSAECNTNNAPGLGRDKPCGVRAAGQSATSGVALRPRSAVAMRGLLLLASLAAAPRLCARERPVPNPYESHRPFVPVNRIDELVAAGLRSRGLAPARLCTDEVFVRRVYLDVIGTLPTPEEVRAFLRDRRPDKRRRLIDALLDRPEYADYWSLKWCDLLRVKAEYPIKLWPNAVQAYHEWVHAWLARNGRYDVFARALLTSSGSNFRVPAVNFYRAVQQRSPAGIAKAVALTLMGTRIETWPANRQAGFATLFSKVAYKKTAEWKEEIVCLDPGKTQPIEAVLPDGTHVRVGAWDDPREVVADWLIRPENPWFAKAVVNRIWAWLWGQGIIHEPDDIRDDNPPIYPELLAYLERELAGSGWNLKHVYRLILNSSTYQQSCVPRGQGPQYARAFACYPVRQLDAEVLIDAICQITGTRETYSSPIPEPYTFIPEQHRTITLPDGSISSQFLETFGRPARDTGRWSERRSRPTDAQRLYLLNSSHIRKKIENSWKLRRLARGARRDRRRLIDELYLLVLSRRPTPDERAAAEQYFHKAGRGQRQAFQDLAWALINTKEFLCKH